MEVRGGVFQNIPERNGIFHDGSMSNANGIAHGSDISSDKYVHERAFTDAERSKDEDISLPAPEKRLLIVPRQLLLTLVERLMMMMMIGSVSENTNGQRRTRTR